MQLPDHHKGKVFITGAGPGDPGLLTLNAQAAIAAADVILYDNLVNKSILNIANANTQLIYTGKLPYGAAVHQNTINEMLLHHASLGKKVVRLKGGDPYIFGRGAEEAAFLLKRNIDVEVIPGITSGIAAAAYAGIPLTHRDCNQQVMFVTGHKKEGTLNGLHYNWQQLAAFEGTIVFYMGVKNLAAICTGLIDAGKNEDTAIAIIENGTLPQQKIVIGNLNNITEKAVAENIGTPALIVVGEVVNYHSVLFQNKEVAGNQKVLLTQASNALSGLQNLLEEEGFDVTHQPFIELTEKTWDDADEKIISQLHYYEYLLFTSSFGVHAFFNLLKKTGKDARALNKVAVAAIGTITGKALREYGIEADIQPQVENGKALLDVIKLQHQGAAIPLILYPCSSLSQHEWINDTAVNIKAWPIYKNALPVWNQSSLSLFNQSFDAVVFGSTSAVKNAERLLSANSLHSIKENSHGIAIGISTAEAMHEAGYQSVTIATNFSIESITEAIKKRTNLSFTNANV